ncbi:MAG: hypothetical protein ABL966_03775 [Acidimicrobiales bacterium]
MGGLDAVRTAPSDAAWCDDSTRLTRWAESTRTELERVAQELRALQTLPSTPSAPPDRLATSAIGPLVATLRREALERLDAEADRARAATDAVVAGAMQQATVLLRSVGADRPTIERATASPIESERPYRPAHLRPAESGLDLRAEPAAPVAAPVLDLIAPDRGAREGEQAFAEFWGDVLVDRPMRDRLRRWVRTQAS